MTEKKMIAENVQIQTDNGITFDGCLMHALAPNVLASPKFTERKYRKKKSKSRDDTRQTYIPRRKKRDENHCVSIKGVLNNKLFITLFKSTSKCIQSVIHGFFFLLFSRLPIFSLFLLRFVLFKSLSV